MLLFFNSSKVIFLPPQIYYEGSEGDQIRLLNEMNVETVVLLSDERVFYHIYNLAMFQKEM